MTSGGWGSLLDILKEQRREEPGELREEAKNCPECGELFVKRKNGSGKVCLFCGFILDN